MMFKKIEKNSTRLASKLTIFFKLLKEKIEGYKNFTKEIALIFSGCVFAIDEFAKQFGISLPWSKLVRK